uniref:Uncharacterized protein n=1 Tax=Rhipicephalus zambeziensis TaxID=60191 RepID=A0A224YHQ7_9ACAR
MLVSTRHRMPQFSDMRDCMLNKFCASVAYEEGCFCCSANIVRRRQVRRNDRCIYNKGARARERTPGERTHDGDDHDDLYAQVKTMKYTVSAHIISPFHESGQQDVHLVRVRAPDIGLQARHMRYLGTATTAVRSRTNRSDAIIHGRCSFKYGVRTQVSVKEFFTEPRGASKCPEEHFVAWVERHNSTCRIPTNFLYAQVKTMKYTVSAHIIHDFGDFRYQRSMLSRK